MPLTDYPALAGLNQIPGKLSYERAIWGKVDGARSDFRWIARSAGFQGHLTGVEKALKVGNEELPRKSPLWRSWQGRYYAVSCYPSRARDAANRSGFLEKQIIEWEPGIFPAALGALLLLREAADLQDDLATSRAGDPRWSDLNFTIVITCPKFPTDRLQEAIACGLRDLQAFSDPDLETLYESIGAERFSILPAPQGPLSPEALAALLLPLPSDWANRLSLAGWVPSRRVDAISLENWHAGACDPSVQPQASARAEPDDDVAKKARRCVQILRGFHPAVQRILDFADGPGRWLDPNEMSELRNMLYERGAATTAEMERLQQAFERVWKDAHQPSGLSDILEKARQRHLRSKAWIIRGVADLLHRNTVPTREDELRNILTRWLDNSKGEVLARLRSMLR